MAFLIKRCMKKPDEMDIVPQQMTGKEVNTEHLRSFENREEAREVFRKAVDRLMDVNRWEDLCGTASANFELTDNQGKEVARNAVEGDYFKIDIPGPGSVEGKGYDWVRIEKIEENIDCEKDNESIAIRVRPAPNPTTPGNEVAHFFNEHATSTFVIEREGNSVKAGIYGRNEKPNNGLRNLVDKLRNTLTSLGAISGMSSLQWQKLSKGLIEGPNND
jgi:hypothetical protein